MASRRTGSGLVVGWEWRAAASIVSRFFDMHVQDALRLLREKPKPKLRKMIKATSIASDTGHKAFVVDITLPVCPGKVGFFHAIARQRR